LLVAAARVLHEAAAAFADDDAAGLELRRHGAHRSGRTLKRFAEIANKLPDSTLVP
jgi:hypothetical protein